VGDYSTAESGWDDYDYSAAGHDEYAYCGPNQGPVKSNSHHFRWGESEQVDSISSYTERGVFGPGGEQGKYASNESYTDRWDYSGSGGSSGSYEDLTTSSSSSDTDRYEGWDRYHYVVSDVGSFTEDGDAGYYSSEETWDGEATRDESRESTYSVTNAETTYVIGPGYSITTPGSTSGNRGSFRVRTESDYVVTAVYHERYDEPAGTWSTSYQYDAVENVDRPETSPCHGESSTWYTGPLGDRSSSFTSDLTDHKHDEWHETEFKEGWSLVVDGERTDGELGSRTTRWEVHSGNLQSHCEETVTANGYTTTTPTDTDHEWSNSPPAIETTTGTAPTDEPTDPNVQYTGPDDPHYDALLAALDADADALAAQAANSTLTPASRAALVDAAIASFTALDADENGENGGATYQDAATPPEGQGADGSDPARWLEGVTPGRHHTCPTVTPRDLHVPTAETCFHSPEEIAEIARQRKEARRGAEAEKDDASFLGLYWHYFYGQNVKPHVDGAGAAWDQAKTVGNHVSQGDIGQALKEQAAFNLGASANSSVVGMLTNAGAIPRFLQPVMGQIAQWLDPGAANRGKVAAPFVDDVSTVAVGGIAAAERRSLPPGAYVEAHGFKFSEYYWNKLWTTGRQAPGLVAREVLAGAAGKGVAVPGMPGFYRYVYGGWEMIYNPVTREVWHLMPIP
jgi:hypothetical protein